MWGRARRRVAVGCDAPVVGSKPFVLPEAEEAHWIELGLRVGAEVSKQRVGEGLSRRDRVSRRIEGDLARVLGTSVLVLAVAHHDSTESERVRALQPAHRVAHRDVRRRVQE